MTRLVIAKHQTSFHTIEMLGRRFAFGLAIGVVSACSGPSATPSIVAEGWTTGDFMYVVPSDWTVHEEPDKSGFTVIDPPTGEGQVSLIEIVDRMSPTVSEAYAVREGSKGIEAVGLPTDGLEAQRRAPGHYSVSTAGDSVMLAQYVTVTVHVFEPGIIVLGYYRTSDATDPNIEAAERILSSVRPAD